MKKVHLLSDADAEAGRKVGSAWCGDSIRSAAKGIPHAVVRSRLREGHTGACGVTCKDCIRMARLLASAPGARVGGVR